MTSFSIAENGPIWSKRKDHLHCNLDLWQIPLLLWASLQARSYLCKWTRTVFPGWNMLPPVWRGLSTPCLPQSRGVVWYFFTLKGISWNILYHWIPKDVPDMVGPWFFRGLIYHQGGHVSSRSSTRLQLLVHPAQVTQCYRYVNHVILCQMMIQILCDRIIIVEGRWINIHGTLLCIHNINFLSLLSGVKKKAFTRLVATFHLHEALLTSPNKDTTSGNRWGYNLVKFAVAPLSSSKIHL